jgi:DNA-binding PadR family transcriptional regulator
MNDKPAGGDVRITRAIIGALRERDLSAFGIWQWLGPVPGPNGELSEATIFPTLHRLEERRLIEGSWQEEKEGTRRKYRITATGMRLADREGWGPIAFEPFARTRYGARDGSRDDTRDGTQAARGLTGHGSEESGGGWAWSTETPSPTGPPAQPVGSVEAVAVDTYLDSLQVALRLSPTHCSDVRNEVADYIADASARLRALGNTAAEAVTEVLEALGPPKVLAERINEAQLTRLRLRRGLSWGSAVATLTGMVAFALAFDAMTVFTPWIVGLIVPIASRVGIHLYAPATAEWDSQSFAVALCIGAFLSARRSMPFLADRSRQADSAVWRTWAVAGVLPLATIAMLWPFAMDPLTGLLTLCPPVAWVLGTRRPARLYGATLTATGLALCMVVATVVTFLPGGRIWFYDSATHPATDPDAARDAKATLVWNGVVGSPSQQVTVMNLPDGWHDAEVQVWPAARIGPVIVPDSSATGPTVVVPSGGFVDFATLPRGQRDWWMAVTAVGPDGHSYVVHNEVHFGYPYDTRTNIIAWLISRL